MYKINVTVKDLTGFSLSVDEMDKVLRPDVKPDSLQATVEKALAMTDDELTQAWGELVDESELSADDTIIVSRQYAQQLHDECAAIADMTGKWLGQPTPFDPLITVSAENGIAWADRRNPGGPDEVGYTKTLEHHNEIYRDSLTKLGVSLLDVNVPTVAETFVDKNGGIDEYERITDNTTVTRKILVKRGDGESITEVYLDDILAKLGFAIDANAFFMAACMVADEYKNGGFTNL